MENSIFYLYISLLIKVVRLEHGGICHHNTDNAHIDKHSGTIPIILARH
jgi:hypothetical protein